jgi:hypothetical protein
MNAMKKRKPILLMDDSTGSQRIKKLFHDSKIDFVEYHIKKFEESCCGELPTTRSPSVIAAEGIFREEGDIRDYIKHLKENQNNNLVHQRQQIQDESLDKKIEDSESAFW